MLGTLREDILSVNTDGSVTLQNVMLQYKSTERTSLSKYFAHGKLVFLSPSVFPPVMTFHLAFLADLILLTLLPPHCSANDGW